MQQTKQKTFIGYILLALFGGIVLYLSGIGGLIKFILSLTFYGFIFYGFHLLWRKFKKKFPIPYFEYIEIFAYKISIFILIICSAIGGFAYYHNSIAPAQMPEYILTDGEKTVIFQGMSHIGTEDFYKTIAGNLTDAKEKDFVYFYEGVAPGTDESLEKFNQAIGIKFDPDLYENFSKLYGVSHQDQSKFMGLVNDLDFNIDLNMDQIIEEYEKNPQEKESTKLPMDANEQIINSLAELNEKELKVLVYINQALLNFIIKSDALKDTITNNFGNKELFDVILHKRNEIVADAIIASEYNKIYTTYGLLHFEGILELLKENNANWRITKENYLYPIQ